MNKSKLTEARDLYREPAAPQRGDPELGGEDRQFAALGPLGPQERKSNGGQVADFAQCS